MSNGAELGEFNKFWLGLSAVLGTVREKIGHQVVSDMLDLCWWRSTNRWSFEILGIEFLWLWESSCPDCQILITVRPSKMTRSNWVEVGTME